MRLLLVTLGIGLSINVMYADPLRDASVLESREGTPDLAGRFERVQLLKNDSRYPLLRKVEQLVQEPGTGRASVVNSVTME